jgi:Flp pilus assembly pilin Flp
VSLIGLATVAGMISLGGALQGAYQGFANAFP